MHTTTYERDGSVRQVDDTTRTQTATQVVETTTSVDGNGDLIARSVLTVENGIQTEEVRAFDGTGSVTVGSNAAVSLAADDVVTVSNSGGLLVRAGDGSSVAYAYSGDGYEQVSYNPQGVAIRQELLVTNSDGSYFHQVVDGTGHGILERFDADGNLLGQYEVQRDGGISGTTGTLSGDTFGQIVTFEVEFGALGSGDTDISLTGIRTVGGQPAVGGTLVASALDDLDLDIGDISAGGNGELQQLIAADDASNASGFTPVVGSAGDGDPTAWYNTPEANAFGTALSDVQSLLVALQGHRPLAIATAVFNAAASIKGAPDIFGDVATGLNGATSLVSFVDALRRGDELAALSSGASFVKLALQRYQSAVLQQIDNTYTDLLGAYASSTAGDQVATDLLSQYNGLSEVIGDLAKGLPFVNLALAIKNGDALGIASAVVAIIDAFAETAWAGPVGWALAIIQIGIFIFSEPDINGESHFQSSADGRLITPVLTSEGDDGGGPQVQSVMAGLLAGLQAVISDQFPQAGPRHHRRAVALASLRRRRRWRRRLHDVLARQPDRRCPSARLRRRRQLHRPGRDRRQRGLLPQPGSAVCRHRPRRLARRRSAQHALGRADGLRAGASRLGRAGLRNHVRREQPADPDPGGHDPSRTCTRSAGRPQHQPARPCGRPAAGQRSR